GIGTVNRAFPHHYHHRKTNRPPHPHPQQKKRGPRAVAVQEPHSEREHHKQCNHPTQKRCSCHQRAHHTLTHTPTQVGRSVIGVLVPVNSTHYCASIPGLSTPSSIGHLSPHKCGLEISSRSRLPA